MKQFLYVMQSADGRVKVGISAKPDFRRRTLQTSGGAEISVMKLYGPFNKAASFETMVHKALAPHLVLGEWFDCDAARATQIADSLASSFIDEGEKADGKEGEFLQSIASMAAKDMISPASRSLDLAAGLMRRLEDRQAAYELLLTEFQEACQLVEEYAQMTKSAQHLAQLQFEKIKMQEAEIRRLSRVSA